MTKVMFWDVDTQYDFMTGDGKLYVPEAMGLVPRLQRLTSFAREKKIPIWGSVDFHEEGDPEIEGTPDFKETFPPHCLAGTPGAEKIPVTNPRDPLWIESRSYDPAELRDLIAGHPDEVFFRKRKFDVFSNPNVDSALEIAVPGALVIYGVAQDVCVSFAVGGFLKRGNLALFVVRDATSAISKEEGDRMLKRWETQGVKLTTTQAVVDEGFLDLLR